MNKLNLNGQWTGTIQYGKEYSQHAGKELYFDLELMQYGDEIAGTAYDTGGVGASPDSANILGTYQDNRINFLKQYTSSHYYDRDNSDTKIDRSKKGPIIKYSGFYNDSEKTFTGDWVIRMTVNLFWIIPLPFKNTGTWTMKRKQ